MNRGLVEAVDLGDDAGVVAPIGGGRLVVAGSGEDGRRDAGKEVVVAGLSEEALEAKEMAETGQWPGRAQMYIVTHKNQDGVYVNEATKEICVLGQEHSGRVRCLGLGVVPSRVFQQVRPHFGGTSASSSGGSCSFQCRENYNQMMNSQNQILSAFKAYMIMKEGMIPEQFVGLFDSPSMISPTIIGIAGSPLTRSKQNEYMERKIGQLYAEDFLQGSDTYTSNAMAEDSSESALQILLDFPSNNDMSFLGHSDSYSLLNDIDDVVKPSDAAIGPISPMDARRPHDHCDPNDSH
ncbi:putative triose phosphate/phosphate translocator TPT, chloroplastic-like [Capsicum annuum]|nr:putative triose phosphate/phosphate translocator TPT, chloroplastic-like [Capsicum annuum]